MLEQNATDITARIKDVLIEFGLRRITAVTDSQTISVREPSLWEDGDLVVVVEDHDL